ncbi:MAG: hypothetical protein COC06_00205 [Bacteroidales bacterium]|nr:MAG: hypothetical protein COC06_00205 [Bacteroidales bacterium]
MICSRPGINTISTTKSCIFGKDIFINKEFQRPEEKIRVDRLSRHLYDIYQISKTEYADKYLYESIVKYRYNSTKLGGVDYNLHQALTINFLPATELTPAWKADYKTMQEQMIHGNSSSF